MVEKEHNAGAESDPGDGIVFCSDVVVSEPDVRNRPWDQGAFEVRPMGDAVDSDCPVFVSRDVLKDAVEYGRKEPSLEVGGFLVGGRFVDDGEEFVWIEEFVEGRGIDSGPASARFTRETFSEAWRSIEKAGPYSYSPLLLGWFHTHPGFGAFLSQADRFIHRRFFDLPFFVALVTDPLREELILYRWRDGEIKSSGFHLVERKEG